MSGFQLISKYKPLGDQPNAIRELTEGIVRGDKYQTLLGVTGSGKTFTMANIIQNVQKPTLVISHNKTLAAQLYGEFKGLFPNNAVEYFISYYDYYQPEAYIPATDTYIEKDTSINDEIDRLRLKATSSLLSRRDIIIVASVSCIYGLGSPQDYMDMILTLKKGEVINRQKILTKLIDIQYVRNNFDFYRGIFRVRGDVIEIFLAYEERAVRVEMLGDEIEKICIINPLTGEIIEEKDKVFIFPSKHFVTPYSKLEGAIIEIRKELEERLEYLRKENKLLEAHRLEMRTNYDIEMMQEIGYCTGIENYSRYLSGRLPGQRPYTLIDFFPDDYLMFIDESHVTMPQTRGMYNGDRSRKEVLVEHGFRLPSALDNRPLNLDEFESMINRVIFVSATPADYELEKSKGVIVEQIIRPTGLVDPKIVVRPIKGQIDDLIDEIRKCVEREERVLVTTLTKRMSEDLTEYLFNLGIKVKYLHSEIAALDRVEILRGLRLKEFDVLVGINLLREGLDLPEVSLVAVLDADKEGFLRSERSLIQISGRAARNKAGRVIFYAEEITESMRKTIQESERRRKIQKKYNKVMGIEPKSVYKSVDEVLMVTSVADGVSEKFVKEKSDEVYVAKMEKEEIVKHLEKEMKLASKQLEFEKAAKIRDEIKRINELY
jgi:excinuclease ABC subunit B